MKKRQSDMFYDSPSLSACSRCVTIETTHAQSDGQIPVHLIWDRIVSEREKGQILYFVTTLDLSIEYCSTRG